MKEKIRLAVPAVNTWEAMLNCIEGDVCVFSIENPLYSEILSNNHSVACFSSYDMEIHEDKQFIFMLKNCGSNPFDDSKYELHYLPLQRDGWVS